MKQIRILTPLLAIVFGISCKKVYNCHCEVVSTPQGGASDFKVAAYKKDKAQKECNGHSTYLPNTVPQSYDTYCTLTD